MLHVFRWLRHLYGHNCAVTRNFDPYFLTFKLFHACNYLKIKKISVNFHCSTVKLALIFHICEHYLNINIISQYINTNSQMRHIEIYPLNFTSIA